jgi:hypothetical protein
MTNINTIILLCNDVLNTRANMHCRSFIALYVAHLKSLSLSTGVCEYVLSFALTALCF